MAGNKDPEIGVKLNVDGFVSNAKKAEKAGAAIGKIDLSGLTRGIRSLGSGLGSLAGKMANLAKGLAIGAAAGAAAGIATAGILISKGIKDAMEDVKIADRVKAVFGPDQFDFIDETSQKIKSAFGFDDGESRKAMTTLGEMGMSAKQAANSMSLAADIARAKNMSLEESARLVGKAYQGNMAAAKRLGIEVQKTGDPVKDQALLMDQLQKKFGGSAEAYAKNLPPLEKAKVAISDMVKMIGAKLIPVVVPFLEWVSNSVRGFADSQAFSGFVERLVSGFKTAWSVAKQIGITLTTYGIAFVDVIKQLPGTIGRMWDSGALMSWITAMLGALLKTAWDAAVALGKLVWAGIMDGIPALVGFLGKALTDMLRSALGERVSKMLGLEDVSETFNTMMKDSGKSMADNASKAFAEFGTKAKENFGGAADITKQMFAGGGLDLGGSMAAARAKASGMMNLGDGVKRKATADAADLYRMTGVASQNIGMSQTAQANARLKTNKALAKGMKKHNKQARGARVTIGINLQSADRLTPIMATT